ncbi:MAG: hypothetical protein AB1921_07260 [Thermodesulfobacteriota bacterium]
MKRRFGWKKAVMLAVVLAFLVQTAACGYFLYPERRGRTQGKVDPAVAIMDGACLLLFIIPGVIAFAVDFSSGAIYMAGDGKKGSANPQSAPRVLHAAADGLDQSGIEAAVYAETGRRVDLSQATVRILDGAPSEQQIMAMAELAQVRGMDVR